MGTLAGRTAIITGGARGLGREFALRMGDLGASVGIIDVDLRAYEETGQEIGAETVVEELRQAGVEAEGIEADVRDWAALKSAVDELAVRLGDPTILLAPAGGSRGMRPGDKASLSANRASEMNLDDMRWVMEVNFYGTVHAVNAVVPYMKRHRRGKIVTVASVNGHTVRPDGSHAQYAAAKAAIIQYTKYLAADVGHYGIHANCLAPGLTVTPKNQSRYDGTPDVTEHVAIDRLGQPMDQVNAVEFLVSDASDYITGHVLDVSGGTRIPWWGPAPVREP